MESSTSPFAARQNHQQVEEGTEFAPKFDENGLIPVVTVDVHSNEVLMVAYMNAESLARTVELGEAVYWSRSRKELWHKGATSGLTQKVHEILVDCDQDTLVLKVESTGGACCHVGYRSCFYRKVGPAGASPLPLQYTESDKVFDPAKVYGQNTKPKKV